MDTTADTLDEFRWPRPDGVDAAMSNDAALLDMWLTIADVLDVGDLAPHDLDPGACWRCDTLPGVDPLGLCPPCHRTLTA